MRSPHAATRVAPARCKWKKSVHDDKDPVEPKRKDERGGCHVGLKKEKLQTRLTANKSSLRCCPEIHVLSLSTNPC